LLSAERRLFDVFFTDALRALHLSSMRISPLQIYQAKNESHLGCHELRWYGRMICLNFAAPRYCYA
jgi:hypothetical protein